MGNHMNASMVYQTTVNIFGYGLSGILAGQVADFAVGMEQEVFGWRTTMLGCIPALFAPCCLFWLLTRRRNTYSAVALILELESDLEARGSRTFKKDLKERPDRMSIDALSD